MGPVLATFDSKKADARTGIITGSFSLSALFILFDALPQFPDEGARGQDLRFTLDPVERRGLPFPARRDHGLDTLVGKGVRVLRELLPSLERDLLERALGVGVEPEEEFWIKVSVKMPEDEFLGRRTAAVEIDRGKERLQRICEKLGFEEVPEVLTQVLADQKDVLEFHVLRDASEDLLRYKDRTELGEHAFVGLGEFLKKFLTNDLIQDGVAQEFQSVEVLESPRGLEILIPERRMGQSATIARKGSSWKSEDLAQGNLVKRILGG